MSDYEYLLVVLDKYKQELDRRKNTPAEENGRYYYPSNKSKIDRLRLEISDIMLKIQRQMDGYSTSKESWF